MIINPKQDKIPDTIGNKAYQLIQLSKFAKVSDFRVIVDSGDVQEDIETLLKTFIVPDKKYSIRSSANIEDTSNNAFAGLFETYLNVKDRDILDKVLSVIESSNYQRVKELKEELHISSEVYVSVIIQEMVNVDSSGVYLSCAPNNENVILIEVIYGLGELLVSGKEEPDTITINRDKEEIIEHRQGNQCMIMTDTGSFLLASTRRFEDKITHAQLMILIKIGKEIEKKLSIFPADIEFGFVGDELYIFQCRPLNSNL